MQTPNTDEYSLGDRAAGERKGIVSSISTKELARAMPSPTRQCPLCHETSSCCRADAACYAFEAFGPSGLIAALVFGRAVRVDADDDAGEAVWLSQGVLHGLLRGASSPLCLQGKFGIGGCEEKGPQGPFSFAYRELARLKQYKISRSWSFLRSRKEKGLSDG